MLATSCVSYTDFGGGIRVDQSFHHECAEQRTQNGALDEHEFSHLILKAALHLPEYAASIYFESIIHSLWRNHAGEVTSKWWQALRTRYERVLIKYPWFDDRQDVPSSKPTDIAIEAVADLLVSMHNYNKRIL